MADHYALVTKQRPYSSPATEILLTRAPFAGTITKFKVVVANASASGDAEFDLLVDGVSVLMGPLQLLESSLEADTGAISVAVTEGQLIQVDLITVPSVIGDDLTVWLVISDT